MNEPITIAGGVGLAFGLTGTFLGMSHGVLIGGVLAGFVVVGMAEDISIRTAFIRMVIALATAAGFGDIGAYAIANKLGWPASYLHIPTGFIIGLTAQADLIPWVSSFFRFLGVKVKGLVGKWFGEVSK